MKMIKKVLSFFIILVILVLGYGLFKKNYSKSNLLVINVLDKNLYDDCHIKGSINVPFNLVEQYVKKFDKNTNVVLYCSNYMCTASFAAARSLQKIGFKNVWVYEAGIAEWNQKKLPVEGPCKEAYLNIKIEKSEFTQTDVQQITTEELREKIKKELNI